MRNKYTKFFILILIVLFTINVKANSINKIDMDVYIDSNGNASVTEIWNVYLNEGTEGYRSYSNLGKSIISNLSVSDETGEIYNQLSYWNSKGSFSSKAYKSGINYEKDSLELCWGISQYGNRTYILKYNISNLVTQYTDTQGIYFNFLNLDQDVGSAIITIHSDIDFSLDNSRIWSFGNNGTINYDNGTIIINSKGTIDSSQYIVGLIRFSENIFSTKNLSNKSFDDIYDEAFKTVNSFSNKVTNLAKKINGFTKKMNNEYGFIGKIINGIFYLILAIIIILLIIIFIFGFPVIIFFLSPFPISLILSIAYIVFVYMFYRNVFGISLIKYIFNKSEIIGNYNDNIQFEKNGKKLLSNSDINYYRDIPCDGDLYLAFWICYEYDLVNKKKLCDGLISAIILKWIKENRIKLIEKKSKFFNIVHYYIDFNDSIMPDERIENSLYSMMIEASGKDKLLKSKEFKIWCKYSYKQIFYLFKSIMKQGEYKLQLDGLIKQSETNNSKLTISLETNKYAYEMIGLKKYLLDFSKMKERATIEVHLWENYLIFSSILGIAKKVYQELEEIYPDFNANSLIGKTNYFDIALSFGHGYYTIIQKEYSASKAKVSRYSRNDNYSGGGGDSFSSGGSSAGGSSGGGFR